jgi:hypothetical protein
MKFYCDYCSKERTDSVFPNLLKTNQETIMNGIMVCDDHKQSAIAKLIRLKMYKEPANATL